MTPGPAADSLDLIPHRAEWEGLAQGEIAALRAALAGLPPAGIQHIGSTAVPGIAARPILDLQVLLPAAAPAQPALAALRALGYALGDGTAHPVEPCLVKGRATPGSGGMFHLRILRDPDAFEAAALFRDALRGDPALAGEYNRLKRDLARRWGTGREAYAAGKAEFLRDVVSNARWATA